MYIVFKFDFQQVIVIPKPSSSTATIDGHHKLTYMTQSPDPMHLRGFNSEIALAPAEYPACSSLITNQKSIYSHKPEFSRKHHKVST
jgi:hypothetical protein